MKKTIVMMILTALLGAGFIFSASYAGQPISKGEYRAYEVSDLVGTQVKSPQGEKLGRISDIAIDSQGRVLLAILTYGGFAGIGGKLVAVPFSALTFDPVGRDSVLNISKEKLESAPAFDKKELTDLKGAEDIYRYFGQQPSWTEGGEAAPDAGQPIKEEKPKKSPSDYEEMGMRR